LLLESICAAGRVSSLSASTPELFQFSTTGKYSTRSISLIEFRISKNQKIFGVFEPTKPDGMKIGTKQISFLHNGVSGLIKSFPSFPEELTGLGLSPCRSTAARIIADRSDNCSAVLHACPRR
jgi:hypothetical protein